MPREPITRLEERTPLETAGRGLTLHATLRGRAVRMRTLLQGPSLAPDAEARFLDRCQRVERLLQAPSVAALLSYDAGREAYVATEAADTTTLEDVSSASPGGLEPGPLATLGEDVARALAAAHALTPPLVHGGLAMSAVLLDPTGHVQVADFAFATLAAEGAKGPDPDVRFRAPEQLRGEAASEAADLFALGALLYEALAGVPTFSGDTPAAVKVRVEVGRYEPLDAIRGGLPPALVEIVHGLLSPRPEDRPTATRVVGVLSMIAGRAERAREALGELVTAARLSGGRSTAAFGPELMAYAQGLFAQERSPGAPAPPPPVVAAPTQAPASEPTAPELDLSPGGYELHPEEPTRVQIPAPPDPEGAPREDPGEDLPVPKTVVMGMPEAPPGRAPAADVRSTLPTPTPTPPPVQAPAPSSPRDRTWLLWVAVAAVAFGLIVTVALGAILLAS